MMRTIHLYGKLKKQFGAKHRFDVATASEALRALNCAFPGEFVGALQSGSFKLVRGAKATGQNISDLNLVNELRLGLADLHLIPVAEGAGNTKGVAKTVLGVALIGGAIFMSGGTLAAPLSMMGGTAFGGTVLGASFAVTWGNIALVGLGLTLMGVSSLLAKPEATPIDSEADKSKTISGAGGNGGQGDAIQLIYGETLVGGVVVSFDSNIENVGAYTDNNETFFGSIGTLIGQRLIG